MPLISIIIPVYNSSNTLNRCVDSILNQTFCDWELLLIDDGSTDGSGEICDKYSAKDTKIKVFHKKNGGVSSARNVGIDYAKGKWITFVDSDDYINPKALYHMVSCAGSSDLVLSSIRIHNNNNEYVSKVDNSYTRNKNEIGVLLTSLNNYVGLTAPWGKLLNLSIIKKYQIKFNEKFFSGEDTLFLYKYIYHVECISCVQYISYNNVTTNGLSRKMLSLDEIDGILVEIIVALENLHKKFNYNIEKKYYDCIGYFITKYNFNNKSIKSFYKDFLYLSRRKYFKDMVNDKIYLNKGFKRNLFDKLFNCRLYGIIVLWTFKSKKIYF